MQDAKEEAKRVAREEQKRRQMELLATKELGEEQDVEVVENPEKSASQSGGSQRGSHAEEREGVLAPAIDTEACAAQAYGGAGAGHDIGGQAAAPTVPKKMTFAQKEAILREEFFEMRRSANCSWLSQSLNLWPGEYYVSADISFSMSQEKLLERTAPIDITEAPWLDNRPHEVDNVWCQLSSAGTFGVRALSPEECPEYAASVTSIAVQPEKFPFSFETPAEASSRGIDAMLTRLKNESVMLDAEYVAARLSIKKVYKAGKRSDFL